MDYEIDYDDERFKEVEADRKADVKKNNKTFNKMINKTDEYYQKQIDAAEEWTETQSANQQAMTDFTIEQIEQQKDQAEKDYIKEQQGAYVDYQKESNRYGANAEQMASAGLMNSGYSESSQVNMYNTYQNRVATARESYNLAVLNYNNAIKEARLQNSSILAEIAYQGLQTKLELSLQGFQYKNSLIMEKLNRKDSIESRYDTKWQSVLDQMNQENALQEQIRQFNASLAEEQRQFDATMAQKASSGGSGTAYISPDPANSGVTENDEESSYEVNTEYYQGNLNKDAKKFGVFKNGYQPRGISGHGKVSKTGLTIEVKGTTLAGQQRTSTQNVWKAEDGTLWYWKGTENEYVRFKDVES